MRILGVCLLIVITLLTGCTATNTRVDKAEREIEIYNAKVEKIMTAYQSNYDMLLGVEDDIKQFFLTLKSTEELSLRFPELANRKALVDFWNSQLVYNAYLHYIDSDDKNAFVDFIKGYSKENAVVEYYMDSDNGDVYMCITYTNIDTRVMTIEIVVQDCSITEIKMIERGLSIEYEDYTFNNGYTEG